MFIFKSQHVFRPKFLTLTLNLKKIQTKQKVIALNFICHGYFEILNIKFFEEVFLRPKHKKTMKMKKKRFAIR